MSDIYYYGNQPMLKYISDSTPCAVPIDKVAADLIESQQATIIELENEVNDAERERPVLQTTIRRQQATITELTATIQNIGMLLTRGDDRQFILNIVLAALKEQTSEPK